MTIGYYVREFPIGISGVAVARRGASTVVVADTKLSIRAAVREALPLLSEEEIREWLDL